MSMQPQAESAHLSRQQPSLALWRPQTYHTSEVSVAMHTSLTPRKEPVAFTSALLLVRHEDHAVVDRQSLRRAGIRTIHILTSGVEAARILSRRQRLVSHLPFPDFALCDEQLSDMTGLDFLSLIRSHPRLAKFPVIMASMHDTPNLRQELAALTASGRLIRPYSGDALQNQLSRAAAMHPPVSSSFSGSGASPDNWDEGTSEDEEEIAAFDRALSRLALARKVSSQTAGQWFREGLQHLKQEQWEDATMAFQQALKEQDDHPDAIRGLTVALRKRQEQSVTSTARRRLTPEAAAALRGNLVAAAGSDDPDTAVRRVVLDALGADSDAELLRSSRRDGSEPPLRVLAGHNTTLAPLPELHEPDGTSVLGRFPLLRDAVNVARITLGLYRTKRKD